MVPWDGSRTERSRERGSRSDGSRVSCSRRLEAGGAETAGTLPEGGVCGRAVAGAWATSGAEAAKKGAVATDFADGTGCAGNDAGEDAWTGEEGGVVANGENGSGENGSGGNGPGAAGAEAGAATAGFWEKVSNGEVNGDSLTNVVAALDVGAGELVGALGGSVADTGMGATAEVTGTSGANGGAAPNGWAGAGPTEATGDTSGDGVAGVAAAGALGAVKEPNGFSGTAATGARAGGGAAGFAGAGVAAVNVGVGAAGVGSAAGG